MVLFELRHQWKEMEISANVKNEKEAKYVNSNKRVKSSPAIVSHSEPKKRVIGDNRNIDSDGVAASRHKSDQTVEKQMQISHTTHYSGKRSADTPKTERVKTPAIVESGDGLDWITTVTRNYSANSWRLLQRYESLPSEISVSGVDGGEISAQKPVSTL